MVLQTESEGEIDSVFGDNGISERNLGDLGFDSVSSIPLAWGLNYILTYFFRVFLTEGRFESSKFFYISFIVRKLNFF